MKKKLMVACVVMLIGIFLVGGMALAASFRGSDGPDEISGTKRADTIRGLGGNDLRRLEQDPGQQRRRPPGGRRRKV